MTITVKTNEQCIHRERNGTFVAYHPVTGQVVDRCDSWLDANAAVNRARRAMEAAAPAMLVALESILATYVGTQLHQEIKDQAYAAIANASR